MPEALADLSDPDTLTRGAPHDTFRTLRREAPVYLQKGKYFRDFWAFTKYDDIVMASKDPARFSSARGSAQVKT